MFVPLYFVFGKRHKQEECGSDEPTECSGSLSSFRLAQLGVKEGSGQLQGAVDNAGPQEDLIGAVAFLVPDRSPQAPRLV